MKKFRFKKRKKEIISLVVSLVILLIILVIGIVINEKNNIMVINTKENKEKLEKYNKLLDNIKNNMEEISISNYEFNNTYNWSTYKLNLDGPAKSQYDLAIARLKDCYLYYRTNDFDNNTDFIRKFKNYDKVSKKEFDKIMLGYVENDNICFGNIANDFYYVDYEEPYVKPYEDNYDVKELELFIKPIVLDHVEKRNKWYKPKNYEELLNEEYYRINLLNNLSEYLKIKYERESN